MGSQVEPADEERKRLFDKTSSSSTMRGGGPGPAAFNQVLLLMAHTVLALDFSNPSKCVSTIVSCCNPDQPPGEHPFRCFEVNECAGLYWEGTNACSDRTVARAIAALSPSGIETRVAHIDDNLVEIEIERRPIPRQREKLNEVVRRKKNWIRLRPGTMVRPRVHPASNKHYLTISGIGTL